MGVSLRRIYVLLLSLGVCIPAIAGPLSLGKVISGIQNRYNSLATLVVGFEQTIKFGSRPAIREAGILYLRRPSKMRWDYINPKGKLLIADGEVMQMYNPRTNQVRRLKFSATADFRAPLSFLLGRLRLKRQFRNLRLIVGQEYGILLADGLTGREVYRDLEFRYEPETYRLIRIKLSGQDQSITTFEFNHEKTNVSIGLEQFEFSVPAGAEVLRETFVEDGR